MKTVVSSYENTIECAAEHIKRVINAKPDAVIALTALRSAKDLYSRLAKMFKNKEISFSRVTMFEVTEYVGIPPDDKRSCRSALEEALLRQVDIKAENCHFLTEDGIGDYDALISAAGDLDLALVSIGANAQLEFNSVGTEFDTYTHIQKLPDALRAQLAADFGEDAAPQQGMTMGIKTICSAGDVVVLACGEEKADGVFKMLYARNDTATPAAFLQIPGSVTAYVDDAAAVKL